MTELERTEEKIKEKLLSIVYTFLMSVEKSRAAQSLSLNSKLNSDLGIDSLGRVELFHRIEDAFGVYLPESLLVEAETLQEIFEALRKSDYSQEFINEIQIHETVQTRVDPSSFKNLVEVLVKRGQKEPSRVHLYFQDEKGQEHPLTYGELLEKASIVASHLHQLGLKQGQTVAIMLPTCLEFFYVFMGCMLSGIVPVPIYPPLRPDKIEEYALREASILKNAEVQLMVTFHRAEKLAGILKVFIPSLKKVLTADELVQGSGKVPSVTIKSESPGFIQYTSGSTSSPKGVLLSHANLLANIRAVTHRIQIQPGDVGVTWLPLYHDMGLIGCWLTSFYNAMPVIVMSPLTFLSRPERWLWAIHYHRATLSAAPNFAYELCIKRIDESKVEGLDLSTWRLSFNGAEAINPETIRQFYSKFERYGLAETVMYPSYGLAESSVALILPEPGEKPHFDKVDKAALEQEHKANPSEHGKSVEFVSVGFPIEDHDVKIVNDKGETLPDRTIGRLVFKGPSVMQGYYRQPEATEAATVNGYLDSGDYAYKAEGQFYITGRRKDLIIKAGRNFYPEEIEGIVAEVSGIRKGCIIAFGTLDEKWGTEKLIIVAETKETQKKQKHVIHDEIVNQVNNVLGISPDEVILLKPGQIPKTSSGKLQRSRLKQMHQNREIKTAKMPVWLQVVKLTFKAGVLKLSRGLKGLLKIIYSGYVFTFVGINLLVVGLLLYAIPKTWQRKLTVWWARFALRMIMVRVQVVSPTGWPSNGGHVFVSNHASYIDAVVLLAYIPENTLLVGKKEVVNLPLIGRIYRSLGAVTVDRHDFTQNISDAEKITLTVKNGTSVAIFPEGTFSPSAGLRSFKMGAFKVAVDAQASLVPLALKGTRNIYRGSTPLLCPGKVTLYVGEEMKPQGTDWNEVSRLHAQAKDIIARHCGEAVVEY